MQNKYKIADLVVQMDSFGRTKDQAFPYRILNCDNVDIYICSNRIKIKEMYPGISDSDAEYLSTGANFYKQLLNYSGLMLHASAVVVDGNAYLFSADSGTGKSTHTKLWLELFGDRAYILNDDKPALRLMNGIWYAYGTPWSGKNDISMNIGVPIAGICMLERGERNEISTFSGKNAVFEIYAQTNRPKVAEYRVKLLELLDKLIRNIPVWKLTCNTGVEAAIISYEAMSGKKIEER